MTESKRIRFGFKNNNFKGHVAATLLQAEVKVLLSQKGLSSTTAASEAQR